MRGNNNRYILEQKKKSEDIRKPIDVEKATQISI